MTEKITSQLLQLARVIAFSSADADPTYNPLIAAGSAFGVKALMTTINKITMKKIIIS